MNQSRLLACPSCSRHVRADEGACPFCAAALPATFAGAPAAKRPVGRLSRAALYALGATSLTLAAGCSGKTEPGGNADAADDGAASGDSGDPDVGAVAAYGAAADAGPFDADESDADDGGGGTDGAAAAYGSPPHDAGKDSGFAPPYGVPPHDAGKETGIAPPYGVPPHDS